MKALFLREVRRLAPYGLGGLALTLGAWWSPWLLAGVPRLALSLTTIVVTVLLGVAAVAPDTAAGGTAFLLRLPLRPGRVAATKAVVAGAWALLASAPLMLAERDPVGMALNALIGFSAGLLASVLSRRTLPALCVTPLVIGVWLVLGVIVPVTALDAAVGPYTMPAMAALSLGLAVLAFARGDAHRASARPALIAAAGLAPTFVLVFAGSAAAHAWTLAHVVPGALRVRDAVAVPGGPRLAVSLRADLWSGRELAVAVLEADRAWLVPARGATDPTPSPDGRFLLLSDAGRPGGWVVDLDARSVTRVLDEEGPTGLSYTDEVWGSDGLVALVRGRASVQAFYPREGRGERAARPLPAGATYVGLTDDGRALLVDTTGVLTCDLPRPGQTAFEPLERVLEWPAALTCEDARPAPGRRLLVADATGATHVVDLVTGGVVRLQHPERLGQLRHAVSYSPDGRCALALRRSEALLFDLSTGERLGRAAGPPDAAPTDPGHAPAWTPDGQAVALPWGQVLFLGEHAQGDAHCATAAPHAHAALGGRHAAGFVLDRAVLRDAPLSLARPFSTEPPVVVTPAVQGGVR